MYTCRFVLALIVAIVLAASVCAAPLGNAFTYQGKLTDSVGAPQNGSFNMSFKLYDSLAGGSQVGSTVSLTGVAVTSGLFSVQLDFGSGAFAGQKRWLETTIGSQTLSPRAEIASTPNAVYAQSVPWSGVTGAPTIPATLPPSGAAGGDLTGTYPNPTLAASAVGTADLADGAVTAPKLAAGALGNYSGSLQNLASPSANPTLASTTTGLSNPKSIAVSGRYVYVVNYGTALLHIYDASGPSPSLVGTLAVGSTPMCVAVSGRYAYVGSFGSSFQVVDISNPSTPSMVGSLSAGNISSIAICGRYAYLTDYSSGYIRIVDISVPSSPVIVGSVAAPSQPQSIVATGRYAYATCGLGRAFVVIDASNPASPSVVANIATTGVPNSVAVSGRFAYVYTGVPNQLLIYDIAYPANPTLKGSVTTGSNAATIALAGRYVYALSTIDLLLQVVDVNDPASPSIVGSLNIGGNPAAVAVSGRYAYIANYGSSTLQVMDVTGIETTAMNAHSLEAGTLQVRSSANVANQLTVGGGLNVGAGGIFSAGDVAANGQLKGTSLRLGTSATAGRVLTTDATGLGTWQALPASSPPSGTAGGDLTGSYPNPTIAANAVTNAKLASDAASLEKVSGGAIISSGGSIGIGVTGPAAKLDVGASGTTPVYIHQTSATATVHALDVTTTGLSDAGNFVVANAANTASGIYVNHLGTGNGVFGYMSGSGRAGYFQINRSTSTSAALESTTNGTGPAFKTSGAIAAEFEGDVGIGTASPLATLQVEGYESSDADNLAGPLYVKELTNTVDTPAAKTVLALKRMGKCGSAYDSSVAFQLKRYASAPFGANTQMDIVMGNGSTPKPDTTVMSLLANGNVGVGQTAPAYKLDVNGTIRGSNVSPSDARFKTNIRPISDALASTMKLRGVTFDWNRDAFSDRSFPEGKQIGVIAQEVEKVFPELVSKDDKGYESVAYDKLVPVLIEAIKTQQGEIDMLKAQMAELMRGKAK